MNNIHSALKTDLYELTMAAAYRSNNVNLTATFELFCYKSHPERSYFIACGLEQAVDYLLNLRFSKDDIAALKNHPVLKTAGGDFFEYLDGFRFTGDVWAIPEGSVFFPFEPVIQVTAPIIEAQIIETYLLSTMHLQTLVATKASRVVKAASAGAGKRTVVEFGSRRAHGPEAAVLAARASYIGGCRGTSNVYAGVKFGIPTYGTMAHSWVQALDKEEDAFLKYNDVFPENTTLLIDTYDTVRAAKAIAALKRDIQAVRIDSGDLCVLSKRVRKILDDAGLGSVRIMASGNLNEYKISDIVKKMAPIDAFGVGTEMVTSSDLPSLDLIYKLVETRSLDGKTHPKSKCSPGKTTLAGRKQLYRFSSPDGAMSKDLIALFSETPPKGASALLEPVIEKGRLIKKLPAINEIRARAHEEVGHLPSYCSGITSKRYLKTVISPALKRAGKPIC